MVKVSPSLRISAWWRDSHWSGKTRSLRLERPIVTTGLLRGTRKGSPCRGRTSNSGKFFVTAKHYSLEGRAIDWPETIISNTGLPLLSRRCNSRWLSRGGLTTGSASRPYRDDGKSRSDQGSA